MKMTSLWVMLVSTHRKPDRIPVALGSTPISGISMIAYHNLTHHLGVQPCHTRAYDAVQQVAHSVASN